MPIYKIPVCYGMVQFMDVEAESLAEAIMEVQDSIAELPIEDSNYIDESMQVDVDWAHAINHDNLTIDDVDAREYKEN